MSSTDGVLPHDHETDPRVPSSDPPPGPGAELARLNEQDLNLLIQAMTTEHFTLQTARGISVNEAIGRTGHLWTAVTGGVVALAFIAQVSQLSEVFFLFALAVLPVLFFLGATTYVRLVQNAMLSAAYVVGVDRIRELYRQVAPASGRYLLPPRSPDSWPTEGGSGQLFFTHATQAAVLTSLIGGVLVAVIAARAWQAGTGVCAVVAAVVSVLVGAFLLSDQRRQRQRNRRLLAAAPAEVLKR
jgi:hypothetical protein